MKIAYGFRIAALLLLLPDAYISFQVLGDYEWWWKILVFIPAIIYLIIINNVFSKKNPSQRALDIVFGLSLCIFFPTLIFTVISLFGLLIGVFIPSIYNIFNWIGLGATLLWLLMSLYGITFGWKKITIKKINLSFNNLPSEFNGFKIVHLSDFHIGTYLSSPSTVTEIVSRVNSLNPDLIVFTGDMVNNNPDEVRPFISELKNLQARYGVISVLGNHDYCYYRSYTYPDNPQKALEKLVELERQAGWRLLRNEAMEIVRENEKIAIVGVENASAKAFINKSDLKKALSSIPLNEFKILLSHDPSHWRNEVLPDTNIDLTLSGHTHGMQFKIGKFSPAKWIYPEWGGVYRKGLQTLVVSTGIGENVAFRFGAFPQILEITLNN